MSAKVAAVVGRFPQWSERFIARELTELVRRGVEVYVFALRRGALPFGPDPEFDPLVARLQVLPRTLTAAVLHLGRPPRGEEGTSLHRELGLPGLARSMKSRALVRALRLGGFTHIHAHFANWPSTIGWLAARETGLPFTFSAHARDLFVEPQLLEEKAADAVACFACHSRGYERLRQLGNGSRAVLMRHGLPLEHFPFREQPLARKAGEPARIVCAGRFVPKKGLLDLIEALTLGELKGRAIELTLVGAGEQQAELERAISARALAQTVRLVRPESSVRLRERLSASDVLVAPCREAADGDHDGVPNVVVEAFALGVPVVGTNGGGLPDLLTSETGFVAPAGQAPGLSRALAEALDDPQAAWQRARTARTLVEGRHDIRTAAAPLLRMLKVT